MPLAVTRVVLASSSKTRRDLLVNAGVDLETVPSRVDEEEIRQSMIAGGAGGGEIAEALAERKSQYVSRQRPGELVIGADQILACDDEIYSKPADLAAAHAQLLGLRGRDHTLFSCVCAVRGGQRLWHCLDQAFLTMRNFSDTFADSYLETIGDSALDGPGCYRLEGPGAQLFSRVTGDYFTILGLPLLPLLDYLRVQGALSS